ncbi:MAG: 2-isopropylmalate synthase [Lachnospiraceae bacterium]|nr:2-isopropylmalate synthase [Lachnospiraceae bacterium]
MKGYSKYKKLYFMPPTDDCFDWVKKDAIEKAPVWCSVDLRDGNQALITPMSLEQKIEFFKMLIAIGFKEIEIGFPAASDTEYEFTRALIEQNLIPEDVTIQVLTQAREEIIRRTFDAVKGAPRAVIHLYNSVSVAQREQVFKKSKEEIKQLAVDGAKLLKELADETQGNFMFEYSPESFTGTEPEYALEVCNAVTKVWQPTPERKIIYNFPATVEHSSPHVYACQIEYMCKNLDCRDSIIVSLHPHNDRGTGVADAELGILAGADRIEGTLFGNGERTGNVDIVTLAMNMYSQGVDPELDFTGMLKIADAYEEFTNMQVTPRQPYAGTLVFTAFSGSHQDAIAKGMKHREEHPEEKWTVPYLPIDPKDIGRNYEGDVIRINSQSGKGGVSYVLEHAFGIHLPKEFAPVVSQATKEVSDHKHKELSADDIHQIFMDRFVDIKAPIHVSEVHYRQENGIMASVTSARGGVRKVTTASGNGRLDAVSNALKMAYGLNYKIRTYTEHALGDGSDATAISYVGIEGKDGRRYWGAGIHPDIITASVNGLVTAINQML